MAAKRNSVSCPKKGAGNVKHFNKVDTNITPQELDRIALAARYVGGDEHKGVRRGTAPRFDSSKCQNAFNRVITADEADVWLKEAIRGGRVSSDQVDGYPKYVWSRVGDVYFEARFIRVENEVGLYKGYPLLDMDVPQVVKGLFQ